MSATRPRSATKVHWIALVIVLVTLACALGLHGWVSGEVGGAGTIRPPGDSRQVPSDVRTGGPVLGTHSGGVDAVRMPDRTVVLTFDDGPDPTWTPLVLDVLGRHRVPGTFFVLGSEVLQHPDIVRRQVAEGHELGNHTFTHPDLTTMTSWQQRWQLNQTQLALVGVTGRTTTIMRPPYSFSNVSLDDVSWQLVREAHDDGYVTVLADLDSRDWERPGADAIVRNSIPRDGRGAVVLLHDAGGDRAQTVAALDRLIPALKAKGYRFTTLHDALGMAPDQQAETGELWRGRALLWATQSSSWVAATMAVILVLAGTLTLTRLLLMVLFARRHGRTRRGRVWGETVGRPVSVIVPAYNEKEGIEAAVRSIVAGGHPLEVVVVDDGSTDGTADIVEALRLPQVTVVRQENAGKPAALNHGVAVARYDLVVLVDGDTRFEPDTVRQLVQPFADPGVGAVSGNAKVGNRRGLLGRWQHIEYVMGFNLDRRLYDVLQCMPTIPGAVGAFRREALFDVGGVSDDTLAEDTDLTAAIVRAGWKVVYEQGARAWTEAPATWEQLWKQRYRWCYGTLQAMWKHRRAVVERGASGRFGRRGLVAMALFQVLLPLAAPAMDAYLLYGLFFLDIPTTLLLWVGFVSAQLLTAAYAFRLDGESLRPLWSLPLQQAVYRQLMYLVVIQSVVTAVSGVRLPWVKLRRTGDVELPGDVATGGLRT
jgi:cellulose synthase/poly-beta-1,6-N-acetylglucosamine synthase-like glycosyltransferase/peptidoglycan/xylan/chitin deacetylase (PgdA/CDA1 family)